MSGLSCPQRTTLGEAASMSYGHLNLGSFCMYSQLRHQSSGYTQKRLDVHNSLMQLLPKLSFENKIALTFLFNVLKGQFDQTIGAAARLCHDAIYHEK